MCCYDRCAGTGRQGVLGKGKAGLGKPSVRQQRDTVRRAAESQPARTQDPGGGKEGGGHSH